MDIVQFKVERQRLYARQTYYRKQIRMNLLKEQVAELEQQYTALKHDKKHLKSTGTSTQTDVLDTHRALAVVKVQLMQEQRKLRQCIIKYETSATQLAILTERMEEDKADQEDLQLGDVVSLIDPLTPAECLKMGQDSYKDVRHFIHSVGYMMTGARVFGWKYRRELVHNMLRFALTKRFTKISPLQLSTVCWRILVSPKLHAKMYSSSMCAQFRVMQVIDENNVVLLRSLVNTAHKSIGKALLLLSRVKTPNGYLLLFKPLARERLVAAVNEIVEYEQNDFVEQWFDIYSWILLEGSGEDCKVHYGGAVPGSTVISMAMWMLELLFITLRFEAQVFGPIFSLSSSE